SLKGSGPVPAWVLCHSPVHNGSAAGRQEGWGRRRGGGGFSQGALRARAEGWTALLRRLHSRCVAPIWGREVGGGRATRQPGQVRKEAALTSAVRVARQPPTLPSCEARRPALRRRTGWHYE